LEVGVRTCAATPCLRLAELGTRVDRPTLQENNEFIPLTKQ
jgi:hypothetical protein